MYIYSHRYPRLVRYRLRIVVVFLSRSIQKTKHVSSYFDDKRILLVLFSLIVDIRCEGNRGRPISDPRPFRRPTIYKTNRDH